MGEQPRQNEEPQNSETHSTDGFELQQPIGLEAPVSEPENKPAENPGAEALSQVEAIERQLNDFLSDMDKLVPPEDKAVEIPKQTEEKTEQTPAEPEKQSIPELEKKVITLPQGDKKLAEKLSDKIIEYAKRGQKSQEIIQDPYKAPEIKRAAEDVGLDSFYKSIVLSKLLSGGNVDVGALAEELKKQEGDNFSQVHFDNAVDVAEKYVLGGDALKELVGGTGLDGDAVEKKPDAMENKIESIPAGVRLEKAPEGEAEIKTILAEELVKTFSEFVGRVKYVEGSDNILVTDKNAGDYYTKALGLLKSLKGRDFNKEVIEGTKQEVAAKGYKAITKKEWFGQAHVAEVRNQERHKAFVEGVRAAWAGIPEEERKAAGSIKQFANQLEKDRKELIQEGYTFSQDVYYQFFKEGYDPRSVVERGLFFNKGPFRRRIEMEKLNGEKRIFSRDEFEAQVQSRQQAIIANLDKVVPEKLSVGYEKARTRWIKIKIEKAGNIVMDATNEYQEPVLSENGSVKPGVEAPKVETLTLDQEEEFAKKESEKRLADLANLVKDIVDDFSNGMGLSTEERGKVIESFTLGKALENYVPLDLLKAISDKRSEIKAKKDEKLLLVRRKKVGKMRGQIYQRLVDLKAI